MTYKSSINEDTRSALQHSLPSSPSSHFVWTKEARASTLTKQIQPPADTSTPLPRKLLMPDARQLWTTLSTLMIDTDWWLGCRRASSLLIIVSLRRCFRFLRMRDWNMGEIIHIISTRSHMLSGRLSVRILGFREIWWWEWRQKLNMLGNGNLVFRLSI
jgi:hypothetical protein